MPQSASAEPNPISSFWMNDDGWQVAWPAALAFAILFHGVAFVVGEQAPAKRKADPIVMAIALPPPPPEVIAPPPEPEPPKPKPKEKKVELPPDIPPPPNETPPVETNEPPPPIVTGVTADSVVDGANSGINVRVGNTTFGDPNKEPLTKAQDVQPIRAKVQFDAAAYRRTAITMINKQKRYPRKARVMGLEGNVIVRVELDRAGRIVGAPVVMGKGSGHDVLDGEAIRMVQAAAPFPDIVGDDVELPHRVVFPVQFRLIDP